MVQQIEIQAIPNQSFSARLDDSFYQFVIQEVNGEMAISITRDSTLIISGQRIIAGMRILPYAYEEHGNFIIDNMNDDLIYYDKFGISQFLYYFSQSELLTIRAT